MHALPRSFYDRPVQIVARQLLGKLVVRATRWGRLVGRIVEAEAYLAQDDAANHAFRGLTRRNASMFGPPGHAYVYAIHSRFCLNAVTEPPSVPSAVLIRAVEPIEGLGIMARLRGTDKVPLLASGPARLCEAFQIDRQLDGWDLTRGEKLWIAADAASVAEQVIQVSARVGVTAARDLLLRYYVAGNRFVSRSTGRATARPAFVAK